MKENCGFVTFNPAKDEVHNAQQPTQYTLPDGSVIQVHMTSSMHAYIPYFT